MTRRMLFLGALLFSAGCLFKGPDFFSIVEVDDNGLPQTGDVLGSVQSSSGAGIGQVSVTLTGPVNRTATTAGDGAFSFVGLAPGSYAVAIDAPAGHTCDSASRIVVVPADGSVRADFVCTPAATTGTVSGTVTSSATGSPISGATVTVDGQTATTASDGTYTISNVQPGQRTVSVTASGFTCVNVTTNVVAGGTATGNVTCTPPPGSLSGTVTQTGSNAPLPGATVALTRDGSQIGTATTNSSGQYSFANVPAGEVTVAVAAQDFDCPDPQTVTVPSGGSVTADFSCAAQQSTLTADDLSGSWTWGRMRTSTTGNCIGPIPTTGTGSISVSGDQLTVTGLHPDVVLTGPFDPAAQSSTTQGSTVLPNGVRLDVERVGVYVRGSGGQIQMTGQMSVEHILNSILICTEIYGVTGALAQASSATFKRDVVRLLPDDVTLLGLRPVAFRYRPEHGDPAAPRVGLIAEEVAGVFPGAVAWSDEGRPVGIFYGVLTGLLLEDVQDRIRRSVDAAVARVVESGPAF